jgi:uridine kinase
MRLAALRVAGDRRSIGRRRGTVTDQLGRIVSRLRTESAIRAAILVGVDGPGGAGKTSFAAALTEALRSAGLPAAVVHFDDFFLPSAERPRGTPETKPIGSDFDWHRLRDEVLLPLRQHRVARYGRYDWARDALAESHELPPRGIVIVEGVYCTRRELADLYDVRVWVECPRDVRLARGIRRDGESARGRWELDWQPGEERYVREHAPSKAAHFVVQGTAA